MTNPMINPNYSGVTIQIANPAVYADGGVNQKYGNGLPTNVYANKYGGNSYVNQYASPYERGIGTNSISANSPYANGTPYPNSQPNNVSGQQYLPYAEGPNTIDPRYNAAYNTGYVTNPNREQGQIPQQIGAYPPQYYLNNYNYQNTNPNAQENAEKILAELQKQNEIQNQAAQGQDKNIQTDDINSNEQNKQDEINPQNTGENIAATNNTAEKKPVKQYEPNIEEPQDLSKSQAVIEDLDARAAAKEAEKKNSKQKRVVALTDEYIKSLENYLNNPNDEIRLMASKEILTRLDEDKDRYNDAALNALLNKMLQDPSKLIRVAALSAFASQLASGNDYTVQLLHNIQQNPNADKEDVLQAADILLKMSAGTEVKNIPNPAVKETPQDDEQNKGPLQ